MIYSEVMNKHNIRRTVRKSGKFIEKHTTKWLETMFSKSKYFLCRLSNPGAGNCFHSINQWNYTISFPIHLQIGTEYRLIPFAVGFISRFILFSSIMEENLGKVYIETLNRKHKLRVKQVQIADRTREKKPKFARNMLSNEYMMVMLIFHTSAQTVISYTFDFVSAA